MPRRGHLDGEVLSRLHCQVHPVVLGVVSVELDIEVGARGVVLLEEEQVLSEGELGWVRLLIKKVGFV